MQLKENMRSTGEIKVLPTEERSSGEVIKELFCQLHIIFYASYIYMYIVHVAHCILFSVSAVNTV